jgi:hypothetical protein
MMAQKLNETMFPVVSRRPFTAEASVRVRASPCGEDLWRTSDTGRSLSPTSSGFPFQYQSLGLPTHIYVSLGRTTGPMEAAVQRYRLTPSK